MYNLFKLTIIPNSRYKIPRFSRYKKWTLFSDQGRGWREGRCQHWSIHHFGLPLSIFIRETKISCYKGRHFYQATQNGARTAIIFAHQSRRTNIKEFWILILEYNNSLTAPWKRCAKIKQKSNRELNWTVIIAINWEFIVTPLILFS